MFVVYAIYNEIYKKIYIGQTRDIDKRLSEHNEGKYKNAYTSRYNGMWKLVYHETCELRKDALLREKQLKSYRGRQYIKKLITDPL